jgi:hypothetical protein
MQDSWYNRLYTHYLSCRGLDQRDYETRRLNHTIAASLRSRGDGRDGSRTASLIVREGYIDWPSDVRVKRMIEPTVWIWEDKVLRPYMDVQDEEVERRRRIALLPTIQEVRSSRIGSLVRRACTI